MAGEAAQHAGLSGPAMNMSDHKDQGGDAHGSVSPEHSGPADGHAHGLDKIEHERPLWWALGLTVSFLVAEVIGAWISGSLALLSDAAHMVTDATALAIALAAIRLGRRPPDDRRTFGYRRIEILAAAVNALILIGVAIYILVEALERFRSPIPIQTNAMLAIGVIGLVVNLICMRLLAAGSGSSLNMRGAYLEVWSDMLGSIGVIGASLAIRWTGWMPIDPIIAVLIGLWVLPRTWRLLREAGNILMEGAPANAKVPAVRAALFAVAGVEGVHDLHIWSITSGRTALTAHLAVAGGADRDAIHSEARAMLQERFRIDHVTLQLEGQPCAPDDHCDNPPAH